MLILTYPYLKLEPCTLYMHNKITTGKNEVTRLVSIEFVVNQGGYYLRHNATCCKIREN